MDAAGRPPGPVGALPPRRTPLAQSLQIAGLSVWIGMLIAFGGIMAPALFAEVASPSEAGAAAGAAIADIERVGLGIGLVVLFLVSRQFFGPGRQRIDPLRLALALALVTAIAISLVVVHPRIEGVQAEMQAPVESYAEDHPLRQELGRWHRAANRLFLFSCGVSAGLLVLTMARRH